MKSGCAENNQDDPGQTPMTSFKGGLSRADCGGSVCSPLLPSVKALAQWLSGVLGRSWPWTGNPPPPASKIKQTFQASLLAFEGPDPTFSNITLPLPNLTDEGSKVKILNYSSALCYIATKQETAGSTAVYTRVSSHLQNNLIVYTCGIPWTHSCGRSHT